MSLHMLLTSPLLYAGRLSFRANRLDIYEALRDKLDPAGRATVQSLPEIFAEWHQRERRRSDSIAPVYHYIWQHLSQGADLADALRPFIDDDEYLMVLGGQRRGNLREALIVLAENSKTIEEMRSFTLTAMAIPVISLVSVVLLCVAMGNIMWPDFVNMVPRKFWSGYMVPCIEIQLWAARQWQWFLLGVPLIAAYLLSVDRWHGPSRNWVDRIPPWSIYKGRNAANLLSILAAMLGSGMSVREALAMIASRAAPYMRWHVQRVISRLDAQPDRAMDALRTGLFPKSVIDRIEDASAGRSFDATLREMGQRSMGVVVKIYKRQAIATNAVVIAMGAGILIYVTVVLVFGLQDSIDRYTAAVS